MAAVVNLLCHTSEHLESEAPLAALLSCHCGTALLSYSMAQERMCNHFTFTHSYKSSVPSKKNIFAISKQQSISLALVTIIVISKHNSIGLALPTIPLKESSCVVNKLARIQTRDK